MNTLQFEQYTALELGRLIQSRQVSSPELTRAFLQRMKEGASFHAYITETAEFALQQAEAVQTRLDAGEVLSPLAGVPAAVKDNICTKGIRTTAGSKMLESFVPPYDAAVMERFAAAGSVLLGKTNLDEFAMGSTSETSYFGPVRNPWDGTRSPGGSSGGSAAAVSGGLAAWALGSDTGGSVRQPCSFCNLSGIKPTYGSLSRYGLIAYASSFDQIGTMGRDILDAAAALDLISEKPLGLASVYASDSLGNIADVSAASASAPFAGLRIGLPEDWLQGADSEVKDAVLAAAKTMEAAGAAIVPLHLPELDAAVPAYYVIACAEASSNLARYDGVRYGHRAADAKDLQDVFVTSRTEGFGPEVKRRILLGSFVLSAGHYDAYYKKALEARCRIAAAFDRAFSACDCILAPAAPTVAPQLTGTFGSQNTSAGNAASRSGSASPQDPLALYKADLYTVPANLAGIPAVSVPCGFSAEGLPIGLQLMGKAWSEPLLVRTAALWQQLTDYHKQRPLRDPAQRGHGTNAEVSERTSAAKGGAAK
ncbi:MAG: Asp-tRNA(Asn)/Glu-tRNA(Gln) amidotransferase subunit GatA [Clostridiales bacterium]|nr:Asp-tRNA(Asn)/Glu-tRNA(Gln) amidotransferase subunit GatA [Clostridiales bacterium]